MSQNEPSSRHPWKRSAFDLRQTVTEVVASIPRQYPTDRMLVASERHDKLHRYLMEYRAMLRPHREKLRVGEEDTHPWDKPIGEVSLPERQQSVRADRGEGLRTDMDDLEVLQLVHGDLNRESVTVTLNNMAEQFRGRSVTVSVEGWTPNSGRVSMTISRPVWMPVRVCVAARDMLDASLEEYGWLPEVSPGGRDARARAADVDPRLGPEDTMPAVNGHDE